jgi:hypothetical protein
MRVQTTKPKRDSSKYKGKSASNWMQLDIAPLVAKRMLNKAPLPGMGS